MRTETTTRNIYQFGELSDAAKEKAREWWRENIDSEDYSAVIDDAVTMGATLGIEIDSRRWTNSYNYTGSSPCIYWSGFSSQGDGACFEGSYRYQAKALAAIRKETSAGHDDASDGDRELLRIAEQLQEVQKQNFYQLRATCKHTGHYSHSGCMSVDVERYDGKNMQDGAEDDITQLLRDFADWIYSQLDKENDWLNSNEQIDEAIECNEYEFTEDGERA